MDAAEFPIKTPELRLSLSTGAGLATTAELSILEDSAEANIELTRPGDLSKAAGRAGRAE